MKNVLVIGKHTGKCVFESSLSIANFAIKNAEQRGSSRNNVTLQGEWHDM
jgi:hypothetical protein